MLEKLSGCDERKQGEFVNESINIFCDYTDNFNKLFEAFHELDPSEVLDLYNEVELFIQQSCHKGAPVESLLSQIVSERMIEIQRTTDQLTLNKPLIDMDWKVNIVLGSDKLANLHNRLTALSFTIDGEDKQIMGECNEEELQSLVNELEQAQQVAQTLLS